MDNRLLGILTLAVSAPLFGGAWWASRRRRLALALGLIIAGGLLLRIFASTDLFLHQWDERSPMASSAS